MVYLIGLTGGIAAGKSVVAARLRELGAAHIDADLLSREAVEPGTEALRRIEDRFGPSVIAEGGGLDRPALAALAFADDEARRDLEGIVHPAVRDLVERRLEEAASTDPDAIVVYDVPLLVESGRGRSDFDLVVVVHADRETRRQRLIERRGMPAEEAGARLDAQASDEDRLAVADVVIDADAPLEDTLAAVDRLYARLPLSGRERRRFHRGARSATMDG